VIYRNIDDVPHGRYRVIYADPPWKYDDKCGWERGGAEVHYDTLALEGIADLHLERFAHPEGCTMAMWTTWPMLREGQPHWLLKAWGFNWVSEFVWDKCNRRCGLGRRARIGTEILLIATRGSPIWRCTDMRQLISAPASIHSKKPDIFRDMLEQACEGPRLEVFGRAVPNSWDGFGNEAIAIPKQMNLFEVL